MAAAATLTVSTAATLPPPPLRHHHHKHANATATLTSSSSSTPPAATCHPTIVTIPRMSPPMRFNRHQKNHQLPTQPPSPPRLLPQPPYHLHFTPHF
nr:hypothetical protein [Tanacetum cinerariifolium]